MSILKLLLPALLPSWKFFDFIAPAPCIQFILFCSEGNSVSEWQTFRPRPTSLSFSKMLGRMVWNPAWNESLFMVSCAERIMVCHTEHSEHEILKRIQREILLDRAVKSSAASFQFRLLTLSRVKLELQKDVVFHSRIQSLSSVMS